MGCGTAGDEAGGGRYPSRRGPPQWAFTAQRRGTLLSTKLLCGVYYSGISVVMFWLTVVSGVVVGVGDGGGEEEGFELGEGCR